MYQELYTEDDLKIRGWNQSLLNKLTSFSHETIDGQKHWSASVVFNVELYPIAKKLNLPTYELLSEIQEREHIPIEKILSNKHHRERKNEIFLDICEMKSKNIDQSQYHTLYTDGCYMEELFFLGYGGYIKNKDNEILVEYTEKIDSKELKHHHEILSLIHGLKLAKDMNLDKLLVLTDSLNNVLTIKNLHHLVCDKHKICDNKALSNYVSNGKQSKLIAEAINLIKDFKDFKIYFIPREENKHADELSRQSLHRNKDTYYESLEKALNKTEKCLSSRKKEEKQIFFSHPNLVHVDAILNPFLEAKEKSYSILEQQKEEMSFLAKEDKLYILEDKHNEMIFCVYHDQYNYEYFLNSIELPIKKSNQTINQYEKEVEKIHYYAFKDALEKITEIKIDNDEPKENLGIYFKNKHVIKLFQCSAKMDLDNDNFSILCDLYQEMNHFSEIRIRHSLNKHHLHTEEVLELMDIYENIKFNEHEFYQLRDSSSHTNHTKINTPKTEDNTHLSISMSYEIEESKDKQNFIRNVKSVAHALWKHIVNLKMMKVNSIETIVDINEVNPNYNNFPNIITTKKLKTK